MNPADLTRTVAGQVERYCRRGQHWQPWTAEFFGRDHHAGNGLSTICKACRQAARRLNGEIKASVNPAADLERAMRGWGRQ